AMQTTVPTVRIAARAEGSRQPQSTNTTDTPRSVTRVMPEVGFEETPISPTILEETTTNSTPKIPTPRAATRRGRKLISPASRPGTATSVATTATGTTSTTHPGTSRSVRGVSGAASAPGAPPTPRTTATRELHIVGRERTTVTMPAAATAPAPM